MFGLGTVSYEPGTECFHSSKGRPCCLDKKHGAHGAVPSLGLDLWAPSLPWAAAELKDQSWPTSGSGRTPAHVWVFLGELLLPGSGGSATDSAGQTNQKRLLSLGLGNPGVPDTPASLQGTASSRPLPITRGLPPCNLFLPNNNRQESRGTSQKPRGEIQRPPAPQPPLWYAVFAPFPRSTCQRLELGDLCQALPLSPGEAHISGQHLYPVQLPAPQQGFRQGSFGKLKGHLVLASKTSILRLGQLGRHGCLLTARPRLPVDRPLLD